MRARSGPVAGHDAAARLRCAARVADTAACGFGKTAKMPSPISFTTVPSRSMAWWSIPRCRATAEGIVSGWASQRRVLPSTSVKTKVTGPTAGEVDIRTGATVPPAVSRLNGSGSHRRSLWIFFAAAILLLVWRPSLRMNRHMWAVAASYGVVLGLMNLFFYLSLARIPLGIAVTVEFLGPLTIALAGSRRWRDAFWALLAAAGVVLLTDGVGNLDMLGLLFALIAGVCWGANILLASALGKQSAEGGGLALGMAVAALVLVPSSVANSGAALFTPWILVVGAGVALLSSVIPYSLELEALRRIPPRVVGVLLSTEPAVAALVGLIVLGEFLHALQWVAVLCVVAASTGATRSARLEP